MPQVFFCDPPAGMVGLTADQAERAGHRTRVVDVDPGQTVIGADLYADGYAGRARIVIDEDHGYLLGATFVGPGVEELIHSATIAVRARSRSAGSGTPFPASPPSAKSGCASWRPTAADPQAVPRHLRRYDCPVQPWNERCAPNPKGTL